MVSNLGRVKTKDRYVNNNGTPSLRYGVYKKGYDNGIGYIQVSFTVNRKVIRKYMHVMVMEAFTDRPSGEFEVDHIDNDKSNNNFNNLQWVTHKDNINKMIKFYNKTKSKNYCINENCDNETTEKNVKCKNCHFINSRKVERPSRYELEKLIRELSFVKIGKMYGVNANTIKSWCIRYELPHRKKDLKLI